jgi:hypothetical protein
MRNIQGGREYGMKTRVLNLMECSLDIYSAFAFLLLAGLHFRTQSVTSTVTSVGEGAARTATININSGGERQIRSWVERT